jgi:CRP-like cAMP-binding protein
VPVAVAKDGWPSGNLILSAVPAEEHSAWLPHLESVELHGGQALYYAGQALTDVYFPVNTAVARLGVDRQGATAEYVLLGKEGFVGLNATLGDRRASGHAIAQIPGRAWRIDAGLVRTAFDRSERLRHAILRYVSLRMLQVSQGNLCRARHSIERRLARWLLQVHDNAARPELHVTHELIGPALGVRREAVTMTALRLQARGRELRVLCRAQIGPGTARAGAAAGAMSAAGSPAMNSVSS